MHPAFFYFWCSEPLLAPWVTWGYKKRGMRALSCQEQKLPWDIRLLKGARAGTVVSLLLLRAAARVSQLFSTALRATYMYSETALRSQGAFWFAFLKDNLLNIVLDSTGGIHSYILSPSNGGRPGVFWIARVNLLRLAGRPRRVKLGCSWPWAGDL